MNGPWSEAQKAVVSHLFDAFPHLRFSMRASSAFPKSGLKWVVAFDGIGDPGGRIELFEDEITLWENGEKVCGLKFEEPDSIDRIEDFIRKKRDWSQAQSTD